MAKRLPIDLPSGLTVQVSERVLTVFSNAIRAMDDAVGLAGGEVPAVTARTVHEVLVSGVEEIDGDEWQTLFPNDKETKLLWLLGCVDALLLTVILKEQGVPADVMQAISECGEATIQ